MVFNIHRPTKSLQKPMSFQIEQKQSNGHVDTSLFNAHIVDIKQMVQDVASRFSNDYSSITAILAEHDKEFQNLIDISKRTGEIYRFMSSFIYFLLLPQQSHADFGSLQQNNILMPGLLAVKTSRFFTWRSLLVYFWQECGLVNIIQIRMVVNWFRRPCVGLLSDCHKF